MKNIFFEILVSGKKGFQFSQISKLNRRSFDLKWIFKIYLFFKKNLFYYKLSCKKLNGSIAILTHFENCRINLLRNLVAQNFFFSEISLQVLREIARQKKKGLYQYQLTKLLDLKSNYLHHIISKLVQLNLIKKNISVLKINSKKSNIITLKVKSKCLFSPRCKILRLKKKRHLVNYEKRMILLIVKTLVRQMDNILTEKTIKYGIAFLNKIPKEINKRKIHRIWQKIRQKCIKAGFFTINENGTKVTKIILNSNKIFFHNSIKKKLISPNISEKKLNSCDIRLLFHVCLPILIQKIFDLFHLLSVTSCFFLERFKGHISYKNIYNVLVIWNKSRDLTKTLQQIGRQKILHFQKESYYPQKKLNFAIESRCRTTEQTEHRQQTLISFIKSNFIPLQEIGKFMAIYEKKGLKKIDSKVVKRVVTQLIERKFLKLMKINIQCSTEKFKRIEIVLDQTLNTVKLKKIYHFLSLPFFPSRKRATYWKKQKHLFFNIIQKFHKSLFVYNSIFEPFVYLIIRTRKEITSLFLIEIFFLDKMLKQRRFFNNKTALIKLNRTLFIGSSFLINMRIKFNLNQTNFCFKNKIKLFSRPNLCDFRKTKILRRFLHLFFNDVFLCKSTWFSLKDEQNCKKINNFFSRFQEKISLVDNLPRMKENRFYEIMKTEYLFHFMQKLNFPHCNSEYRYKKKCLEEKRKILLKTKENWCQSQKWDCEFDTNIYAKFLSFSTINVINESAIFHNLKKFRRRIVKLSHLTNLKIAKVYSKKVNNTLLSIFIESSFLNFDFTIKRALEFPLNYYKFDVYSMMPWITKQKIFYKKNRDNRIQIKKNEFIFHINLFLRHFDYSFDFRLKLTRCISNMFFAKDMFNIFFEKFLCNNFVYQTKKTNETTFVQSDDPLAITFARKIPRTMKGVQSCANFAEKIILPHFLKDFSLFLKYEQNLFKIVPFFLNRFFSNKILTKIINCNSNRSKFTKKESTNTANFIELRIFMYLNNFLTKEKRFEYFYPKTKIFRNRIHFYTKLSTIAKIRVIRSINYDSDFVSQYIYHNLCKKHRLFFDVVNHWTRNKKFHLKSLSNFALHIFCTNSITSSFKKQANLLKTKKLGYIILSEIMKNPWINLKFLIQIIQTNRHKASFGLKIISALLISAKIGSKILTLKSNGYHRLFVKLNMNLLNILNFFSNSYFLYFPNLQKLIT